MSGPAIDEIRALAASFGDEIVRTPVVRCPWAEHLLGGNGTRVWAKLEFLQHTGTFKARGALSNLWKLDEEMLRRGITAVSAGNHAIAAAFAAQASGTSAKVVMLEASNAARVERCKSFGAEVVFAADVHAAFAEVDRIQQDEHRVMVHPFEGEGVALGTGTLGLEMCEQNEEFDTLLVPVGGGGLIGGIANAVKQLRPDCRIIGVEPTGADSMSRSIEAGEPVSIDKVRTIADSLGAPFAMPYSFELTRENVDEMVLVDDTQMSAAMRLLFREMNIAIEPACSATTAAMLGPLKDALAGRKILLTFCGSNIDWETFARFAELDG